LKITKEFAEGLENGPGVFMIKNFPTPITSNGKYSVEDIGIMYAGFNTYLGSWVPQSSAGLRSVSRGFGLPLGKVQAEMSGNTPLQGKQANNYFRLHTDRCDCITLMCIQKAPAGGLSRIASIPKIHNTMVDNYPEECARLYKPFVRIWEGKDGYFPLPVWSVHEGKLTSQVSPSYIENAQVLTDFPEKYPGIPRYSESEVESVDLLEEIGCANSYDFMMEPGMVYWLNNHLIYHGRLLEVRAREPREWEIDAPHVDLPAQRTRAADHGRVQARVELRRHRRIDGRQRHQARRSGAMLEVDGRKSER
jgi:hypothetical protein